MHGLQAMYVQLLSHCATCDAGELPNWCKNCSN